MSSTSEVPEGTISADMALAAAAAASEEAAAPAPKARLTRKNSMDLATMAAVLWFCATPTFVAMMAVRMLMVAVQVAHVACLSHVPCIFCHT